MKKITFVLSILTFVFCSIIPASVHAKTQFKFGKSPYTGWEPWDYADTSGILKKWADKYSINIKFERMSYVPSLEAYASGELDAVLATNMDALMQASTGANTSVIIFGDTSEGNDKVIARHGITIAGLYDQRVGMEMNTVSHFLFAHCLEKAGMNENNVHIEQVGESQIKAGIESMTAVVTWNPIAMSTLENPAFTTICDSSEFPGLIQDIVIVNTKALTENPKFGYAIAGAWYEVMEIMRGRGAVHERALDAMARSGESTRAQFNAQLRTTHMYYTPGDAFAFLQSADMRRVTEDVRNFCFAHGLLGERIRSADQIGIMLPNGTILGNTKNIRLRFDGSYTQAVINGTLPQN